MSAMLTDFYEITIARSYFNEGRQDETAVFDLFYRKQPFHGSFAIFAGLAEVLNLLQNYKFSEEDLNYIRKNLDGDCDSFIDYLRKFDTSKLKIYAPPEGTVVFPRAPLLRVEGPIAYCQLIETPLLNAINFPTLICTNALRFKVHAGDRTLMEFGLRRAQGSDGAMAATKYSYMGLFDCTSNILAGQLYNIPVAGTVAHSFVTSFYDISQLESTKIPHKETGEMIDLLECAQKVFAEMNFTPMKQETVAFIAQARCYPNNFLALVDTYDTLNSGIPNFLGVSYGLEQAGYSGKGVRLDSGDLAELSKQTRAMFKEFANKYGIPHAEKYIISASNDINEKNLIWLEEVGHEIDMYGIGTHLVTCERQPALGGVYKLVEVEGVARVKLSEDISKSTIPCKKQLYRCYDQTGKEICDLLTMDDEVPEPGKLDLFQVYPTSEKTTHEIATIKPLYNVVWGEGATEIESIHQARARVLDAYNHFNKDVLGVVHEKQYCVAISQKLHEEMVKLIAANKVH